MPDLSSLSDAQLDALEQGDMSTLTAAQLERLDTPDIPRPMTSREMAIAPIEGIRKGLGSTGVGIAELTGLVSPEEARIARAEFEPANMGEGTAKYAEQTAELFMPTPDKLLKIVRAAKYAKTAEGGLRGLQAGAQVAAQQGQVGPAALTAAGLAGLSPAVGPMLRRAAARVSPVTQVTEEAVSPILSPYSRPSNIVTREGVVPQSPEVPFTSTITREAMKPGVGVSLRDAPGYAAMSLLGVPKQAIAAGGLAATRTGRSISSAALRASARVSEFSRGRIPSGIARQLVDPDETSVGIYTGGR